MNRPKFIRCLILLCFVLATVYASYAGAASRPSTRGGGGARGGGRQTRGRGQAGQGSQNRPGAEAQNAKRQQAMENAASAIDATLMEMLNTVNTASPPSTQKIAAAKEAVDKGRKYTKQFQDSMICEYFMLNAWTSYFEGDADKAIGPATQAFRKDQTNNDARATQAAIAILTGKKPITVRPQRPNQNQQDQDLGGRMARGGGGRQTRGSGGRGGGGGMGGRGGRGGGMGGRGRGGADMAGQGSGGTFSGTVSSGNILNLDAASIKSNWLGQKVGQLKIDCINGSTFTYKPAEANLCILFWKLAGSDLEGFAGLVVEDANDPSTRQWAAPAGQPQQPAYEPQPGRMGRPGRGGGGRDRYGDRFAGRGGFADGAGPTATPVSMQISSFGDLFNYKFQDRQFKFLGLNVDPPGAAPAVVSKLLQSPWPWAQAMMNESAAAAFEKLDIKRVTAEQPILVIVDRTGTVRYAGSPAGFLAPMVTDTLPGAGVASGGQTYIAPPPEQITNQIAADFTPQLTQKLEQPAKRTQTPSRLSPQPDTEITPEDFQAQKLLTYAQGLFIPAGRKTAMTSKTGVDLCRQVIKEYPNTTYADEARKLLRTIPPNEQKRYNITKEEMGL